LNLSVIELIRRLVDLDPKCRPSATDAQKELRDAYHKRLSRLNPYKQLNSQDFGSKVLREVRTFDPKRDLDKYTFKTSGNKFKNSVNLNNTTYQNLTLATGTQKMLKSAQISSGSIRAEEDFPEEMIEERSQASREESLDKLCRDKISKTLASFRTKASVFELNNRSIGKRSPRDMKEQESILIRIVNAGV